MRLVRISAIAASTIACTVFGSPDLSDHGLSLSVATAEARVGRPLTPVSVAGVARRQARRATYGYGAGVVGAGMLAAGTAAAVAATSPYRTWGGGPYYTTPGYVGDANAAYAYSPDDYRKRNGMVCEPGTFTKLDDGRMYRCQ